MSIVCCCMKLELKETWSVTHSHIASTILQHESPTCLSPKLTSRTQSSHMRESHTTAIFPILAEYLMMHTLTMAMCFVLFFNSLISRKKKPYFLDFYFIWDLFLPPELILPFRQPGPYCCGCSFLKAPLLLGDFGIYPNSSLFNLWENRSYCMILAITYVVFKILAGILSSASTNEEMIVVWAMTEVGSGKKLLCCG